MHMHAFEFTMYCKTTQATVSLLGMLGLDVSLRIIDDLFHSLSGRECPSACSNSYDSYDYVPEICSYEIFSFLASLGHFTA